jgi:hypothetical protein
MAVFTEVSPDEAQRLLTALNLGTLKSLRGIEGGIENTNYFATTDQGDWVLTLFERLTAQQLPFYLHLMKHLAHRGIPVPDPAADRDGDILHTVCGKPAAVVNRLDGKSQLAPQPGHCAAVGAMLARMHLAGRDYDREQPNLRGLPWWNETVPVVLPYLDESQAPTDQPGAGLPEPHRRRCRLCRPAPGPGPCRPVSRQRDVRWRAADRVFRLLLRRRGYLVVRHRGVPERLVYRPAHRPPRCRAGARPAGCLRHGAPLVRGRAAPAARACCARARCAFGYRACGTISCPARPACSSPTTPPTSSACCANGWHTRFRPDGPSPPPHSSSPSAL